MKAHWFLAILLAGPTFLPSEASADDITIPIGVISFNNFLPASPPVPGTNAFNLTNYTGSFLLSPDFPVTNAITFNSASFVLTPSVGSPMTVALGDVGPGQLLDSGGNPLFALQFADTVQFSSATLSLTLSDTTFLLSDGTTATLIGSPLISTDLLPSSGNTLSPGDSTVSGDSAVITVMASTSPAPVPEPCSLLLLASGMIASGSYAPIRRKRPTE